MTALTILRSPLTKAGIIVAVIVGAWFAGHRMGIKRERGLQAVAEAQARAEAEGERRKADEAIAESKRALEAAEATAAQLREGAAADAAKIVEAERRANAAVSRLASATRRRAAVEADPGADCPTKLVAVTAQADEAIATIAAKDEQLLALGRAFMAEKKAHVATQVAFRSLKDVLARTDERAAGLELALEQTRAAEFKYRERSQRQGAKTVAATGIGFGIGCLVAIALH